MGLSIRGLTRGVMGGIAAYRRGALQGDELSRERAAEEAARARQAEQDKRAALYQQLEQSLAEKRFEAEGPGREALASQRRATAAKYLREPELKTRLISTVGGQEIVRDVPGVFGPRPRGTGGGGSQSAEQRQYQQILAEARNRVARHDARKQRDSRYRREVRAGRVPERDEDSEFRAVVGLRFARGELTTAERDRLLGTPVSPYGPRP